MQPSCVNCHVLASTTHPEVTDVSVGLIAAGLAVGVVALLVLHLLPSGLSPVRSPVSQYGISRYRAGYRVQTLAYAVAGLGAALGIAGLGQTGALPVLLCAVFAASRAAISWFPMDAPGAIPTANGGRHRLLASAAFLSVALAAATLSRALGRGRFDATMGALSGALAAVMFAALLGMIVDHRTGGAHFGLVERAYYLAMTGWLAVLAVLLAAGR